MGIGVLKVTVAVNIYWDMTQFSLADRYNFYVEKSRSGVFPKVWNLFTKVHDVPSRKTTFHSISEYV